MLHAADGPELVEYIIVVSALNARVAIERSQVELDLGLNRRLLWCRHTVVVEGALVDRRADGG